MLLSVGIAQPWLRWVMACALLVGFSCACQARGLQISDVLRSTEGIEGAFFLSGDRRVLMTELVPYDEAAEYSVNQQLGQHRKERSRLRVLDTRSGQVTALNAAGSHAGTWLGPISPDGNQVVVNWLEGIHVKTRITNLLTAQDTTLDLKPDSLLGERSPVWTSNHSLVYAELADDRAAPAVASHRYSAEYLPQLWRRAWDGKQATASELVSGRARKSQPDVVGRIVEIDLRTQKIQELGAGQFAELIPAPNRKDIVALAWQNRPARAPHVLVDYFSGADRLQLKLFRRSAQWTQWALDPEYDVAPYSVQWSADGGSLLFVARRSADLWRREARFYRLTLKTLELKAIGTDEIRAGFDMTPISEPLQAVWAGADIVISARDNDSASKALYVSRANGALHRLALPGDATAFALVASSADAVFVMVQEALWKIPVRKPGAPVNLTADISGGVEATWADAAGTKLQSWTHMPRAPHLTLETIRDPHPKVIVFEVATGRREVMPRVGTGGKIIAVSNSGDQALVADDAPNGDLYLTSTNEGLRRIRSFNAHLKDVTPSPIRKLAFRGRRGETLHAWLVLPPDYQPGGKYPVIVEVYGGSMRGESSRFTVPLYDRNLNPYVFGAFGYACLYPSIPLEPMGQASNPLVGISHDALAALDAAIADGAVDPSRSALYGHSFGMFTGLGILVETERFKVAALKSGFADMASEFGEFMTNFRLFAADGLARAMMQQGWTEGGQGRLGAAPWEDPERYVRNSGYFNADKIRTPLLLAHGDLDGISMTHSEKMFSALFRQGRDAKFVRYWGEGHNFSSPANIRDLWQRLLAWYDAYLDLVRDADGRLSFEGDSPKSRGAMQPLQPEDFLHFDRGSRADNRYLTVR